MNANVKRGELYFINLSPTVGSEQGGFRPVVVIQNDIGNKFSPTTVVASITSQIHKAKLPTHVEVSKDFGLEKDSVILCEQIRTIDKKRLTEGRIGKLNDKLMQKIESALMISMGLIN